MAKEDPKPECILNNPRAMRYAFDFVDAVEGPARELAFISFRKSLREAKDFVGEFEYARQFYLGKCEWEAGRPRIAIELYRIALESLKPDLREGSNYMEVFEALTQAPGKVDGFEPEDEAVTQLVEKTLEKLMLAAGRDRYFIKGAIAICALKANEPSLAFAYSWDALQDNADPSAINTRMIINNFVAAGDKRLKELIGTIDQKQVFQQYSDQILGEVIDIANCAADIANNFGASEELKRLNNEAGIWYYRLLRDAEVGEK